MLDIKNEYSALIDEVRVGSLADQGHMVSEFFRIFSTLAAENGDTPDMEYCPVLKEGHHGYRVDGFALEILEGDGAESGDLYLAVCDFRQSNELPILNTKDIDRAVDGVEKFLKLAADPSFIDDLEESDFKYQLADLIRQYSKRIQRVRVIVFTNGHLRTRKKVFDARHIGNVPLHINVLDLERYIRIASSGSEPVEIDFVEDFNGAIECLPVTAGSDEYRSYLFAIPGPVLAKVFAAYGNRLLEQNVRTYLQAKTSVNKGILRTIAEEPSMFFAYNNGIAATASSVTVKQTDKGIPAIVNIKDFQIVNGGQTTASLLYARDGQGRDLENIHVQVKLSVVKISSLQDVVPRISEYANTQNKVSLADLASNSTAQIKIEQLSKELSAPQRAGELHSSKWFYERTRGQYKGQFTYKTPSEKRRLELTYPKSQVIDKTDLAKYELSFDGRPHHVSEGAQKCFNRYTTSVLNMSGVESTLSAAWFRRAMAKAIIFVSLDKAIERSEWYRNNRGYKAQIVAYTIAACADGFRMKGNQIDLDRVWKEQSVPPELLNWMLEESIQIAHILRSPPESVRNISEFAKREFCWSVHVKGRTGIPSEHVFQYGVSIVDYQDCDRTGGKEEKLNRDLDFEITLLGLMPRIADIRSSAERLKILSSNNLAALAKLSAGNLNLSKSERNALKSLLDRLKIDY